MQIKIPSGIILLWFINGELEPNHVEEIKGHRVLNCYFRAERYPDFIDILRNEKPLFFYYNREDTTCYITTSDEPVGEGENEED